MGVHQLLLLRRLGPALGGPDPSLQIHDHGPPPLLEGKLQLALQTRSALSTWPFLLLRIRSTFADPLFVPLLFCVLRSSSAVSGLAVAWLNDFNRWLVLVQAFGHSSFCPLS